MSNKFENLPSLARSGHAAHSMRCITGLPESQVELDPSRLAVAFYCLGTLDLLGSLQETTNERDRENWRDWIWEQQTSGHYGSGFKPSSFMTPQCAPDTSEEYSQCDMPHMIMTYTALLSLSILRDDFSRLDRSGILKFLRACQREDGSFSTLPQQGDSDLRTVYCAFAISSMLNDWSGVDVKQALGFIAACRTYEGGYGQSPFCEAQGGTTYTAIASLKLALPNSDSGEILTDSERQKTIRWLIQNQDASGGFRGRTGKEADACYCFWCGAALQILDAGELVNVEPLAEFLSQCQFKYGGISKAPGETPDPYHTYLSLAALSMYSPSGDDGTHPSWKFDPLEPLLNSGEETVRWAKRYIPARNL